MIQACITLLAPLPNEENPPYIYRLLMVYVCSLARAMAVLYVSPSTGHCRQLTKRRRRRRGP